jgi:stage III sporulation protein AF
MIDFLSSWAEQIIVAVIIATIIEMILPDNKNKKYIKMIIGIYILFNIISPIINNKQYFNFEEFDLEKYASTTSSDTEINQESMDKRLSELYIDELEKDIKNKVKEEGYIANSCSVEAVLDENSENKGINKIKLKISKDESNNNENSNINKVEKIEINVGLDKILNSKSNEEENTENSQISNLEIAELRKTLSDYYQVDIKNITITKD